jgi:hypothetical protein
MSGSTALQLPLLQKTLYFFRFSVFPAYSKNKKLKFLVNLSSIVRHSEECYNSEVFWRPATIAGQYTLRPRSFSGICFLMRRHIAGVPPALAVPECREMGPTNK